MALARLSWCVRARACALRRLVRVPVALVLGVAAAVAEALSDTLALVLGAGRAPRPRDTLRVPLHVAGRGRWLRQSKDKGVAESVEPRARQCAWAWTRAC